MSEVLNELKQLQAILETLKSKVVELKKYYSTQDNNVANQKILDALSKMQITIGRIETFDSKNEFSKRFYQNLLSGKLHIDRTLNSLAFDANQLHEYSKQPEIITLVESLTLIFERFSKRFENIHNTLEKSNAPTMYNKRAEEEFYSDLLNQVSNYKKIPHILDLYTNSANGVLEATKQLNELKIQVRTILKSHVASQGIEGICAMLDSIFAYFLNIRFIGTLRGTLKHISISLVDVLKNFRDDILSLPNNGVRDALLAKYRGELANYFKTLNQESTSSEFLDKLQENYTSVMLIHEIVLMYKYFVTNAKTEDTIKLSDLIIKGEYKNIVSYLSIFRKSAGNSYIKRISIKKVA